MVVDHVEISFWRPVATSPETITAEFNTSTEEEKRTFIAFYLMLKSTGWGIELNAISYARPKTHIDQIVADLQASLP